LALENDKPSAALRAYYNVADGVLSGSDRYEEAAETIRAGLAYARKVGNRYWEWLFLGCRYPFYALGAWDDVLAMRDQLPREDWTKARIAFGTVLRSAVPIYVQRGQVTEARQMLTELAELEGSADVQERCYFDFATAQTVFAEGRVAEALAVAESVLAERATMGLELDAIKEALALALQAALQLGQPDKAEQILAGIEQLPPGQRPQLVNATIARFRAHLHPDLEEADRLFKGAAGLFQELSVPFYLAVTRLEHAERLQAHERSAEADPLLSEAREIFARLEAAPWLARVERALAAESVSASS
jgi:tetratricopeptide (TPR) repeat protein